MRARKQAMRPPDRDPNLPRVTVVIPVFNGAAYLAQALDSALAQTFRSFEIIVVDDGSGDASGAIAIDYQRSFPEQVRVLQQANEGLPAARNLALVKGRGEYFALLDADDIWLPSHLARAVAAFDADPDLGLVHADVCRIDAGGAVIGNWKRDWSREPDAFVAIALRREHVACCTAVFTRECWETVGGFDRMFTGLGCEDRDLWLRIAGRYRLRYLNAVTACYRVHTGGMSQRRARMFEARMLLLRKVARTARGAPLAAGMLAMIHSDLGEELLAEGRWQDAAQEQLRALASSIRIWRIWRRLLRASVHPLLPKPRQVATGATP